MSTTASNSVPAPFSAEETLADRMIYSTYTPGLSGSLAYGLMWVLADIVGGLTSPIRRAEVNSIFDSVCEHAVEVGAVTVDRGVWKTTALGEEAYRLYMAD